MVLVEESLTPEEIAEAWHREDDKARRERQPNYGRE
jgi:hypothetical protein